MSKLTKLKIGEFSKMMQVTVKTLRHYEQKGLLFPCEVYNPQNEMFLTFQTNCSFIKNEMASKKHKKKSPFQGNKKAPENI